MKYLNQILKIVTGLLIVLSLVNWMSGEYEPAFLCSFLVILNGIIFMSLKELHKEDIKFLFTVVIEEGGRQGSPYVAYSYEDKTAAEARAETERSKLSSADVALYESCIIH